MAKDKDSLIVYQSFFEATEGLSAVAKAEIWDAMGEHLAGREYAFKNKLAAVAWKFIALQLNADKKKWDATCSKRAEAGRAGMAKRWDKTENNAGDRITSNNKNNKCYSDITNITDTDTDTDIIINNNNKGDKSPFDFFLLLPESFGKSERFRAAWVAWLKYRRERKLAKWTESTLRKKAKEFTEWGVDKTVQAIDDAISSSWQGVFAPKTPPKPTVDHYTLQRAFEWAEGHFLGDYDSDPITATQLDRWASDNGVYDRLKQPLDPMYKHVFKTKR